MRFLLSLMLIVGIAYGQDTAKPDPRVRKAQQLEASQDIPAAIEVYKAVLKDDPDNKRLTYKLASLYHTRGDYGNAVKYYAILAPNGNPTVLYNMACALSMAGKKRKAISTLEKAVDAGFNQLALMRTDKELDNIREHKSFPGILAKVKSVVNMAEVRQFDFWVGHWNVFDASGKAVGKSHIEKILNDVVILENWSGGSGYRGKSFNHYLVNEEKWIQYWVDQNSGRIYFEGIYDAGQGAMVFRQQLIAEDAPQRQLRFFHLSPDSVRQLSQTSTDGGRNWTIEYDFTYVRRAGGDQ